MDELTIGEVARRAGLRTSAIRYYESIGVLPEPNRVNGRRRYTGEVVDTLAVVRAAQGVGFSVAEIKVLLSGFEAGTPASIRWQALAGRKLAEVEAQIEHLYTVQKMLGKALECNCLDLSECAAIIAGESDSDP